MNTFLFTLREGLLNLRRSPMLSLSSVAVMGLSLFVLGIFLLITVNLRSAIVAVQKQVEVVVFVGEEILDAELQNLDLFLREHSAVRDVRFLTRDDALAKFRAELSEKEYLLEALEANPLPDTFEIELFDDWKATERLSTFARQVEGMAGVDEVKYGRDWVGRLNRVIVVLVMANLFLAIVVTLSSLLVVANTVKLTLIARRDMIELMKMIGTTAGVIRRPFVIEGVLQGTFAALFAAGLLVLLTNFLQERAPEVVPISLTGLALFLAFGAFLGGLGSVASLQGFLREMVGVLLAATLLLSAAAPFEEEIQRESVELDRVRTALEKARKERTSLTHRESKILEQLNGLDSDVTLKERLVVGLTRKEGRLAAELERTRHDLERERELLAQKRGTLRKRLRNIYKIGEKPGLQVLLGATSAVDLVRRFDWLLLVAAQDRRLFSDVRESVETVRLAEVELAHKMLEVKTIREESEREKQELLSKREERTGLLSSVRTEKQNRERVVGELEEAENRMQALLAELQERAERAARGEVILDGKAFVAAKGKLAWPTKGRVSRWFGLQKDQRFGTSTYNGGIDIKAEAETEVIAVFTGRVDYVNWLPGYGQCIILSHGGGYYSLYAHTSRVFVSAGDAVAGGDLIASVGDTGSLLGNILHFEIRKDAEPIDPAPWLKSVKLK